MIKETNTYFFNRIKIHKIIEVTEETASVKYYYLFGFIKYKTKIISKY